MTMAAAGAGGAAAGGDAAALSGAMGGSSGGSDGGGGVLARVLAQSVGRQPSKGTVLAVAILLFWLAGVLFFVAFEGSGILGENAPESGSGGISWVKAIFTGLTSKAAGLAQQNNPPPAAGEGSTGAGEG